MRVAMSYRISNAGSRSNQNIYVAAVRRKSKLWLRIRARRAPKNCAAGTTCYTASAWGLPRDLPG